jgi:tungstate transport system permease protein
MCETAPPSEVPFLFCTCFQYFTISDYLVNGQDNDLVIIHIWQEEPIDDIFGGLFEAIRLILTLNPDLVEIILLSLRVSGVALLFSIAIGIPLGAFMGLSDFFGRKVVIALLYTGMGFPPVVIGLFVYLMLSRSGPLGMFNFPLIPSLFTPAAMVMAQTIISFPLVAGFTMTAVMSVNPEVRQQVQSLGATRAQVVMAILSEARIGVIVSVIAGFGGIISEVGAVMLVGGNIEHRTRMLTTAIVLETRKGNFDLAMAIGIILLVISFLTNLAILLLQGRILAHE